MFKQILRGAVFVLVSLPVWAEQEVNRIHIKVPVSVAYDYITQPDRWHDWHPLSKSSDASGGSLEAGQRFTEQVLVGQQDVTFGYLVVEAKPPVLWKVEYASNLVMGSIEYQLLEAVDGVVLERVLEYYPKPSNLIEQRLLAEQESLVRATSLTALRNLRAVLEKSWQR